MMKNTFLLLLTATALLACTSKSNRIDQLSWLEGNWTATVEGNIVTEHWEKENDSTLIGESAFVKDGQVQFTEVMSIRLHENKLIFIAAVSDQNKGEEIAFTEVNVTDKKIVFENKSHDFPQQITYELTKDNNLSAYISGEMNGQQERIDFKYTRVKK
jgi:hypothetical protein